MVEFKKGDVVQLTSGGPHMICYAGEYDGKVECHWFSEERLRRCYFPCNLLVKIQDAGMKH
jgi:uncharacterized protein YodC (DUF2158 family)